ncbi:hypothetical protein EPZ47_12530 [Pseudomonas viciae]|uniref:Uncharacterized protein n=1 Tax=Pseudomonas viciae TaxID=2505979 RepID=A0A4P7PGV5_9PSED|nr:hypothetical protein EPZ47_12530 [Pseudomonas viciae]
MIEELVALVNPLVLWVPGVAVEIAEALVKPRVSRSLAMLDVSEALLARSVRVAPVCLPLRPWSRVRVPLWSLVNPLPRPLESLDLPLPCPPPMPPPRPPPFPPPFPPPPPLPPPAA